MMTASSDVVATAQQRALTLRPRVGGFPYLAEVLRQVTDRGPIAASEFDGERGKGGWWGWSDSKAAFEWNRIRTAPVAVTRQNQAPCRVPGVDGELPAHSRFVMKMRQAQRADSPAGFEFASAHWSFCPASRYMEAIFAEVHAAARNRGAA